MYPDKLKTSGAPQMSTAKNLISEGLTSGILSNRSNTVAGLYNTVIMQITAEEGSQPNVFAACFKKTKKNIVLLF